MTETKVEYSAKQQSRYIRLSPTTLYLAPECCGSKGKPDILSDACVHCFIRKQCHDRQEVVWR